MTTQPQKGGDALGLGAGFGKSQILGPPLGTSEVHSLEGPVNVNFQRHGKRTLGVPASVLSSSRCALTPGVSRNLIPLRFRPRSHCEEGSRLPSALILDRLGPREATPQGQGVEGQRLSSPGRKTRVRGPAPPGERIRRVADRPWHDSQVSTSRGSRRTDSPKILEQNLTLILPPTFYTSFSEAVYQHLSTIKILPPKTLNIYKSVNGTIKII